MKLSIVIVSKEQHNLLLPTSLIGFQITFEFEENDFMEQTGLTKIVETEFVSEHLTEITCKEVKMVEDIKWKVGKDVTIEMKKQRANKKNASKKPVLKKEPRKSFFRTFFRTIDIENPEEIQDLLNKAMEEMGYSIFHLQLRVQLAC